jgi:hypothetical protein
MRFSHRCLSAVVACVAGLTTGCDEGLTAPTDAMEFAPAQVHAVGGSVLSSLVAADLDNDGRNDLIAVARAQGMVRVLFGQPGGTFAGATGFEAGVDPLRSVTADVDADGQRDLLVIGHGDNAFHVRRGLGNGAFAPPTRYALRNHGRILAVGKLNDDEYDDVVAVHDGSGQPIWINVFLGGASGELQPAAEISTPYVVSRDVAIGDFDADGRSDVVVATGDQRVALLVFRGLGTGRFEAPTTIAPLPTTPGATDGTQNLDVADVNSDGYDDLIVVHREYTEQLVVRLASGAGMEFLAPLVTPLTSPLDVVVGDLNGDSHPDAVVSHLETGQISLHLGIGNGRFEAPSFHAAGSAPTSLVLADFDNDGRTDVAVADVTDDHVRILRNTTRRNVSLGQRR